MSIDLSSYSAIATALLVRIQVDDYRTTPSGSYTAQTLTFSDWNQSITYDSEVYLGLGKFVGITATNSNLKAATDSLTITISGIPNTSIAEIVNSRIKGSPIEIRRLIFDPVTKTALSITGNPAGRFFGIINNYALDEDYDVQARTSTNTISLICASTAQVLEKKLSGRKTNSLSQKTFYPTDLSMDRVSSLVGANFNFGAPQ